MTIESTRAAYEAAIRADERANLLAALGGARPPVAKLPVAVRAAPRAKLNGHTKPKKWSKRPSELLAHLAEQLAAYVAKNPGQRMETIASALRVKPKDLTRPAQKLRAAGRIFTTGAVHLTEYYPKELGQ